MKNVLFALLLTPLFSISTAAAPAAAAGAPGLSAAQPVTISAARALEWDRKARTYTALQDVVVTQGTTEIRCDRLTARYAENDQSTNIKTLEAAGHVTIASPPYTAYGDKAVYDVQSGNAVLTGHDLHITSDADLLTAVDRIEYSAKENRMTAVGQATATHGEDTLKADKLSAYFAKDANGKMAARKIMADSNVTIKTARETATGDSGVYDLTTQKAVLNGKVSAAQGQNHLNGTRADVDMTTGISQLSGDGANGGRVTGTFYPKSAKPSASETK